MKEKKADESGNAKNASERVRERQRGREKRNTRNFNWELMIMRTDLSRFIKVPYAEIFLIVYIRIVFGVTDYNICGSRHKFRQLIWNVLRLPASRVKVRVIRFAIQYEHLHNKMKRVERIRASKNGFGRKRNWIANQIKSKGFIVISNQIFWIGIRFYCNIHNIHKSRAIPTCKCKPAELNLEVMNEDLTTVVISIENNSHLPPQPLKKRNVQNVDDFFDR